MGKVEIFLVIIAFAVLAFRIYQKYIKKDKGVRDTGSKNPGGSISSSSTGDDDYEPYAKK